MISVEYIKKLRRRIELSKKLSISIAKMSALIGFQAYDVYQLCELCFDKTEFYDFYAIRQHFDEQWLIACSGLGGSVDNEIVEALKELGSVFGSFDASSSLSQLKYTKERIENLIVRSETELERKKKVYYCLGLFLGIMICLLLV